MASIALHKGDDEDGSSSNNKRPSGVFDLFSAFHKKKSNDEDEDSTNKKTDEGTADHDAATGEGTKGELPSFLMFLKGGEDKEVEGEDSADSEVIEPEIIAKDDSNSAENKEEDGGVPFFSKLISGFASGADGEEKTNDNNVESILAKARDYAGKANGFQADGGETTDGGTDLEQFRSVFADVLEQLKGQFGHLAIDKLTLFAFMYYLEKEESIKTPSWKRRKHRFMPSIDLSTVHSLHDALYLCEVSYLDTIEDIQKGLDGCVNTRWEMIYCTVESKPREPAHFVAVNKTNLGKNEKKGGFVLPWQRAERCLEVLLVVRGTKELGDVASDCMLDASDYRGGKVHNGIADAGRFLVEKHTALLEHLLEESKYDKIQISLVGHSLGAGAASIAAMEFNDHPSFEARCIGFGCPAILDKDLSGSTREYITTVVSDSDCVPRLSGATVANMVSDVLDLDWSKGAADDVKDLLSVAQTKVPFGMLPDEKVAEITQWAHEQVEKHVASAKESTSSARGGGDGGDGGGVKREEVVLFPPGKCIHFYRDGVAVSACFVPCHFFDSVDVTRTMVNDHMTSTGYERLFLELMRGHLGDSRFVFRHDVVGLSIEKDKREEAARREEEEKGEKAAKRQEEEKREGDATSEEEEEA